MSGKVLLIEDNAQNAYLVSYLMGTREWIVACAANGSEGLERAKADPPDLILLDIQLPGMDGYEVARRLVALPELQGVPIIAVTSYAMPGDRANCLAAGCTGYIEKPIDPNDFTDRVERIIEEGR